jgi:CheY-like chemotaxis protein
MDGVEATRRIRALDDEYAWMVPIIALTANAVAGNEKLFLENGFQAFVSKPINLTKMDSVVRQWITTDEPVSYVPQEEPARPAAPPAGGAEIDIPGVNAKRGLSLYEGDRETYISIIRSFAVSIPVELDRLRSVSEETLPDYAIDVHTVKGASASIGARDISRRAKELELLSKSGDIEGVSALNEDFLKDTDTLIEDITKWLDANEA